MTDKKKRYLRPIKWTAGIFIGVFLLSFFWVVWLQINMTDEERAAYWAEIEAREKATFAAKAGKGRVKSLNAMNEQLAKTAKEAEFKAAQEKVLQYFRENDAKTVLDAAWLDDAILGLGMRDNGTPRDGFAAYACEAVRSVGYPITPITIRVIDVVQLRYNKKWETLGRNRCDNITAEGKSAGEDVWEETVAEYKSDPVDADMPRKEDFKGNQITFIYDQKAADIHGDHIRVLNVLAQKCPPLFEKHGATIQYIAPQLYGQIPKAKCNDTLFCPLYGWPADITFSVKMTDKAAEAADDILIFWAGAGNQPGFVTRQPAAQHICGWPENDPGDDKTFRHVDAPELSFLNDVPPLRFLDD